MKVKKKYGAITRKLTDPVLKELYLFQEKSLQDIALSYGCTRQMICLLMDKCGIKRRERISAVKLAGRKGKFRGAAKDEKRAVFRTSDKRRELRSIFPYAVEYKVMPALSDGSFRAMCSDISDSGLCLYLSAGVDAGRKIIFKSSMPLPHSEATVRWCSRVAGNVYKAGLTFSDTVRTPNPIRDLVHLS
jgi:hypothetical protein